MQVRLITAGRLICDEDARDGGGRGLVRLPLVFVLCPCPAGHNTFGAPKLVLGYCLAQPSTEKEKEVHLCP